MNRFAEKVIDELCKEGLLLILSCVKVHVETGKNHPGFAWAACFVRASDGQAPLEMIGHGWSKSEAVLVAANLYQKNVTEESKKVGVW